MNIQQTDIFSMLGIAEPKEKETKKVSIAETSSKKLSTFEDSKQKENKSNTAVKKTTQNKNNGVGDKFKLKIDTMIKYAGQEVPVTRYFTIDEITNGITRKKKGETVQEEIQEKDLIKKLNQDFAELVPQLTSLVYYEKKNIVIPVLQARKKGVNTKEESVTDSSFLTPKRIPFKLLSEFIAIAKTYANRFNTEIHADIYYDYDCFDFFMDFPRQEVHEFWTEIVETPQETAFKFIDRNYRKVMEIHSHHKMAPIPSSIDNEAERSPILYAIVGHIDRYFPEITVRTFSPVYQKYFHINPEQVFEYPFSQQTTYNLDGVRVIK